MVLVLLDNVNIIQGSDKIIDWADKTALDQVRKLTSTNSLKYENHADKIIGIN